MLPGAKGGTVAPGPSVGPGVERGLGDGSGVGAGGRDDVGADDAGAVGSPEPEGAAEPGATDAGAAGETDGRGDGEATATAERPGEGWPPNPALDVRPDWPIATPAPNTSARTRSAARIRDPPGPSPRMAGGRETSMRTVAGSSSRSLVTGG
jgi:hypothetical protein